MYNNNILYTFIIFHSYLIIKGKSSIQREHIFNVYLPISGHNPEDSEIDKISSTNYVKFAVERDWNSKVFHICIFFWKQRLSFFYQNRIFFLKKIGKSGKFAVKLV